MEGDPQYVKRFNEFVAMLTIAVATVLFLVLVQLIIASP
jgi:branched-subunit amino acid transport protein AzlD